MKDWNEIRQWRREKREKLISARVTVPRTEKEAAQRRVIGLLRRHVPELEAACIGFYWPFRGEIDLRPLLRELVAAGATAALPVVVEKGQPLEFRAWQPGTKLEPGVWSIPVPAERRLVEPDVVLAPLVGFDGVGYRLGYGGGYYDRTLAAMSPRPLAIGIGYELGRLATIHPRPHDIPMDAIATEAGLAWLAGGRSSREEAAEFASPPCSMHELSPEGRGYMSGEEQAVALTGMLSACRQLVRDAAPGTGSHAVRCCTTLIRHIERMPSDPACGRDVVPACACANGAAMLPERLSAGSVAGRLRALLPRIADDATHADLNRAADLLETMPRAG